MPRKIRQVVGRTDLCGARGMPSSLQVSNKTVWFRRHWSEFGARAYCDKIVQVMG